MGSDKIMSKKVKLSKRWAETEEDALSGWSEEVISLTDFGTYWEVELEGN